jgi:hypothetical protein
VKSRLSGSDIGAVATVAVPLWEAAASSRPQDPDDHEFFRFLAARLAESGAAKETLDGEGLK